MDQAISTTGLLERLEGRGNVRAMFEEQMEWIVEAGMDFVIGETFSYVEEALIALDLIREAKLPAVMTLAIHRAPEVREGHAPDVACRMLEEAGADVVGLNCIRGPKTLLPLIKKVRAAVDCHVGALPVPYRTTEAEPSFQSLTDPDCDCIPGGRPFPTALDPFTCNRYEIGQFATEALEAGIRYMGVCCGNGAHHTRSMAEALGRTPPASRYSADMSKHSFLGDNEQLKKHNRSYATEL
jgi:betaine-homocysteine S-methyltransferase